MNIDLHERLPHLTRPPNLNQNSTPTGFNIKAQGREAHPGKKAHASRTNPNGVQHHDMCNPFGVGVMVVGAYPGCAARPRAMLLDRVAVIRTLSTKPNGVQHQSPGSRSAPWEESARVTHEPQRGSTSRYVQPLRGWCDGCACVPGVRCVTPGYVVGPHCGHPNIVHKPQRGSTSKPRVAKRTLGKLFRMHCSVLGIEVRKFIQCPAMVVQPSKFRQKLHTCGSSHAWEEDHICDHGICSSAWSSTRTSDRRR
jgi:hypothetical protein